MGSVSIGVLGGAKSLAASATRSAVAFPIEVGSSPWVWELMCIKLDRFLSHLVNAPEQAE
jgi:hypothetical protein